MNIGKSSSSSFIKSLIVVIYNWVLTVALASADTERYRGRDRTRSRGSACRATIDTKQYHKRRERLLTQDGDPALLGNDRTFAFPGSWLANSTPENRISSPKLEYIDVSALKEQSLQPRKLGKQHCL